MKTPLQIAWLVAAFSSVVPSAQAFVLTVGETARVDYGPGPSGPGTPAFSFIALGFNFGADDPFGPNESLAYSVYAANNTLIGSGTFNAGSSIYTSGLFAALTLSVFPSPALATTSFYATVTPTLGSFDLLGGQADLYNFAGGASQFGSVGTASAVPEPATWAMLALGFGAMGFGLRKRRQRRKAGLERSGRGEASVPAFRAG